MSRGIVLFGMNNARINYVDLAIMASAFIKKNMPDTPICLITDSVSLEQHDNNRYNLNSFFDHVVTTNSSDKFENTRLYRDTRYYTFKEQFRNERRSSAYDLSPFYETLLLDSDYLMCNDSLGSVWGSTEDVMINKNAVGLMNNQLGSNEIRLNPFGIKMYWATAIYFRKSEKAQMLFSLVDHIKDNWDFYKLSYDFPGGLFRNDYAFSIAIYLLSGCSDDGEFIAPLPNDTILTGMDTDQFFKINSPNDLSFFANDTKETWKFYVSRTKGLNVHCMNKLSLLNNMDRIMEVLGE